MTPQTIQGMTAAKLLMLKLKSMDLCAAPFDEAAESVKNFMGYCREQGGDFKEGFFIALTDYLITSFDGAVDVETWNPALRKVPQI